MSIHVTQEHLSQARTLVEECHSHGGQASVDINRFWEDDHKANADSWSQNCPQVPLGIRMSTECIFHELGVTEDQYRMTHDDEYRIALARRYNDKAEKIVGRRLLDEHTSHSDLRWPEIKGLHDIFEAENRWHGESYWLTQSASTPADLAALLDRVEQRLENLRVFILPQDWDQAKARITGLGGKVPRYRGQRGPITFAMSIYGVENLIFLILDKPDLAARLRDLILRAILERARILDEEAGYTAEDAPHGFYWFDDSCAMLTADMYEFFGYPILQKVFGRYSPNPDDCRGQHSDSDMGHLLPVLGKLNLTTVNFGPNLKLSDIREQLPNAVIYGQLAPFTFSRNEEVNIVAEFLRDFEMARDHRGLVFTTAGSINNGSRLTGMRLIMAAIQQYGRYER
jgi:uroporphyrinogen decarboxylase